MTNNDYLGSSPAVYIAVFDSVLCWLTVSTTINTTVFCVVFVFFPLHNLFYFKHLAVDVVDITKQRDFSKCSAKVFYNSTEHEIQLRFSIFQQLDTKQSTNWYENKTYQSTVWTDKLCTVSLVSFNITIKVLLHLVDGYS